MPKPKSARFNLEKNEQFDIPKRKKRAEDDSDNNDDDDIEDLNDDVIPSERQRLQAKRARRDRRVGLVDDDDDNDNDNHDDDRDRSLQAEGVAVEPFHMEQEKNDGTGFFDGDTYIFRKQQDRDAGEADAWLDGLQETDAPSSRKDDEDDSSDEDTKQPAAPQWSKEEWYAKVLPLLNQNNHQETIMQAVVRYGNLLKRQRPPKGGKKNKKQSSTTSTEATTDPAFQVAQTSLTKLTEAANALLKAGEVDIYQTTRQDILKLVGTTSTASSSDCYWEYKGQDGNIRKLGFLYLIVCCLCFIFSYHSFSFLTFIYLFI